MNKATILLLSTTLLSACAPVDEMTKRNTAGQPPNYADGYSAGCGSGYVAAGHPYAKFSKDITKYLNDPIYKTGWDDGFSTCKSDYQSTISIMK